MKYGDKYELLMGSWAARSGMYLELWERQPSRRLALWAFYSDADGSIEFERHMAETPAEVELWFQEEARRRLPPFPDAEQGVAGDRGTSVLVTLAQVAAPRHLNWGVRQERVSDG